MKTQLTLILLALCVSISAMGRPALSVEFGGALNWLLEDDEMQFTRRELWDPVESYSWETTSSFTPVIGLGMKMDFTDNWYISMTSCYHPLSSELEVLGLPFEVEMTALSWSVQAGYRLWRGVSLELGPQAYGVIDDAKLHLDAGEEFGSQENDAPLKQDILWGVEGGVSYAYGPWSAQLHYTHTFTEVEIDIWPQFSLEARSLALTIGYRFYAF